MIMSDLNLAVQLSEVIMIKKLKHRKEPDIEYFNTIVRLQLLMRHRSDCLIYRVVFRIRRCVCAKVNPHINHNFQGDTISVSVRNFKGR